MHCKIVSLNFVSVCYLLFISHIFPEPFNYSAREWCKNNVWIDQLGRCKNSFSPNTCQKNVWEKSKIHSAPQQIFCCNFQRLCHSSKSHQITVEWKCIFFPPPVWLCNEADTSRQMLKKLFSGHSMRKIDFLHSEWERERKNFCRDGD